MCYVPAYEKKKPVRENSRFSSQRVSVKISDCPCKIYELRAWKWFAPAKKMAKNAKNSFLAPFWLSQGKTTLPWHRLLSHIKRNSFLEILCIYFCNYGYMYIYISMYFCIHIRIYVCWDVGVDVYIIRLGTKMLLRINVIYYLYILVYAMLFDIIWHSVVQFYLMICNLSDVLIQKIV